MVNKQESQLLRLAFRLMRYFLLSVFGIAIAFFLSGAFGFLHPAWAVLTCIGPWLLRSAVLVGCFVTIAVIFESIRR
jgi:hypothetical protein